MRFARKLFMLALLALAAMALGASSAAADGAVEVLEESSQDHCGEVHIEEHLTEGGCEVLVHNASTHIQLIRHIPGTGEVIAEQCDNNYRINIGEDGEGYVNDFHASNPGGETAGCGSTVTACDQEEDESHEPWPIHIEETGDPEDELEHAEVRICLDIQVGGGASCEIEGTVELALTRNENGHVDGAEGEGGVILEDPVVIGHPPVSHATCEGLAAQLEIVGHWELVPGLIVTHLD
jgi:hypothetical protein